MRTAPGWLAAAGCRQAMNRSGRTRIAPSLAICRWRTQAQMAVVFGDDPQSPAADQLASFAFAAIDGAFVARQADRGAALEQLLRPLVPSLVAASWPAGQRGLTTARFAMAGPGAGHRAGQVY